MKWEKDAREVVDAIPVHEIIKNMVILWAEKLARKKNSDTVTMEEVQQTRDDYFAFLGPETMERIQKMRDEGMSDEQIDPMIELNRAFSPVGFSGKVMAGVKSTRRPFSANL